MTLQMIMRPTVNNTHKKKKIQGKRSNASITKLGFTVNFSNKRKPRIKVHSTKQQNNYTT